MFPRHVKRKLSAYYHNQLPPDETRRVAGHLDACPACRAELEEITFGIQLAEKLPRATAPEKLWNSIEEALETAAPAGLHGRFPQRFWRPAFGMALLALLVAGGLAWYFGFRQPLRVTWAASEASPFERAAMEEHNRRVGGLARWEIETTEIPQLRSWVHAESGLSASIPEERPVEDAQHLRLVGAKVIEVGGTRAAVIGYAMDSQPVTLATARLEDLREAPQQHRFSKEIAYRYDADHGTKVLTWGADGQAYVMVSSLAGFGQQGCFLCHTAPERRSLIRNMNARRN